MSLNKITFGGRNFRKKEKKNVILEVDLKLISFNY